MTPVEKVNVWFEKSPDPEMINQNVACTYTPMFNSQNLRQQRKAVESMQPSAMLSAHNVQQANRTPLNAMPPTNLPQIPAVQRIQNAETGCSRRSRNDENDGESIKSCDTDKTDKSSKNKKKKSGFLDKPKSNVVEKLIWPHMNQNPRYVTSSLNFNQLTFQQFVGGETRTIQKCKDEQEKSGRLRLLSKVAYLFEQCKNWDKARAVYFAIISSIEEGEADWDSQFGHYDMMCPWVPENDSKAEKLRKVGGNNTTTPKREFFCKDYQKGECSIASPHRLWIKNQYEMVEHYCMPCFKAKMGKLVHVPNSPDCSQRK